MNCLTESKKHYEKYVSYFHYFHNFSFLWLPYCLFTLKYCLFTSPFCLFTLPSWTLAILGKPWAKKASHISKEPVLNYQVIKPFYGHVGGEEGEAVHKAGKVSCDMILCLIGQIMQSREGKGLIYLDFA